MRYIIETTDAGNDVNVWNSITALKAKGLISVIEKGNPVEDIKENLRKVVRAQQVLEQAGINRGVMEIYLSRKSHVGIRTIQNVLDVQADFYKQLGIKLK